MRVTGEPVLRQQELNDAFSGAIYASGLSFVLVALVSSSASAPAA